LGKNAIQPDKCSNKHKLTYYNHIHKSVLPNTITSAQKKRFHRTTSILRHGTI